MTTVEEIKEVTAETTRKARPWIILLARMGYATRGLVYVLIGLLALQAAMGLRSADVDRQDVLYRVITAPFGRILLIIIGGGLAAWVVWMLARAFLIPEVKDRGKLGPFRRAGYVINGLANAGFALATFQLLLGLRHGPEKDVRDWTALAFINPLGQWLVALIGLVIAGLAVSRFILAVNARFHRQVKEADVDPVGNVWAKRFGQLGSFAQGVIYIEIGLFLIQAAWQHDPNKAGGMGDALRALAQQPYGFWALAGVAVGLMASGAYQIFLSRYRDFPDA